MSQTRKPWTVSDTVSSTSFCFCLCQYCFHYTLHFSRATRQMTSLIENSNMIVRWEITQLEKKYTGEIKHRKTHTACYHACSWAVSWIESRMTVLLWLAEILINPSSASHYNWCTGTVFYRIITAQHSGMGWGMYKSALRLPCPTIHVLSYSNCQRSTHSISEWIFRIYHWVSTSD